MDDGRVDDAPLTQHQAALFQVSTEGFQDPAAQFVFFQQTAEVEDGSFVRGPVQMLSGKMGAGWSLTQGFLYRRIAVAKPVMHEVYTQHGGHQVGWMSTLASWVARSDQHYQRPPRQNLIHLYQEALTPGLFALAGVLCIGEGQLLHPEGYRWAGGLFRQIG